MLITENAILECIYSEMQLCIGQVVLRDVAFSHTPLALCERHYVFLAAECAEMRVKRLQLGDYQFGCGGMHHGIGSLDCPTTLHHHHDVFCNYPTKEELEAAGINPNTFKVKSRK